jgi:hypothetical protein
MRGLIQLANYLPYHKPMILNGDDKEKSEAIPLDNKKRETN